MMVIVPAETQQPILMTLIRDMCYAKDTDKYTNLETT